MLTVITNPRARCSTFRATYEPDAQTALVEVEYRHHEFRHGIVLIEDYFRSQCLWHECTQDQNVRHVVDVDQVITPPEERTARMTAEMRMKAEYLYAYDKLAAAAVGERHTEDVEVAARLASRRIVISQAYQVHAHALFEKGICGPAWTGVSRIGGKHDHRHPLSLKMRAGVNERPRVAIRFPKGRISRNACLCRDQATPKGANAVNYPAIERRVASLHKGNFFSGLGLPLDLHLIGSLYRGKNRRRITFVQRSRYSASRNGRR